MRAGGGLGLGWLSLAVALPYACSNTRLEYPEVEVPQDVVDDELALTGEFCSSRPADVPYPVKIMFIVDGSGSQQFSDQNRQRAVAVEQTINALIGTPNVYFKVIVFNASITATPPTTGDPPPPVFTNDLNQLVPALDTLGEADTLTDYQGALAVAYAELQRDMQDVSADGRHGPAELGRSKYVLVFISDGFPDPLCQIGLCNDIDPNFPADPGCGGLQINRLCEDQDFLNCLLQAGRTDPAAPANARTVCDAGVCTYNGTRCFESPDAASLFGGLGTTELVAGADYNQPYQILAKVHDLIDLAMRFGVGDLRVHTGLVLDPLADPAIIAIFGDPARAVPLMQEMARAGGGTYMEFYGGDAIDLSGIDYAAIKQPRSLRLFFADNRAALVGAAGTTSDSDFDGLPDDEEAALGTSPRSADTDGDGYSDALEVRRAAFGFDPLDPCVPALVDVPGADLTAPCDPAAPMNCDFEWVADPVTGDMRRQYIDTDRDGLHDCEERALGTRVDSPDTDHDGLPDRIEVIFGLDPAAWSFENDDDRDGIPNGQEVAWHLNPMVQQSEAAARTRYRYDLPATRVTTEGRTCYSFNVRRIKLVPTLANDDLGTTFGINEVRVYVEEGLADDAAGAPLIRTACLRARYVPPSLKVPASGSVQLADSDFRYLPSNDGIFNDSVVANSIFDETLDCVELQ